MIYLSAEQNLFLHARLVAETGGSQGLRELNLLLSAVGRPQAAFEGQELYPDIDHKAAALFDSLVHTHPFMDGNKRTAIAAASIFLRQNGLRLIASPLELEVFTLAAAKENYPIDQIAVWFKGHTKD